MGAAIGFAAIIIVFAIFIPHVLNAVENFLLAFLERATVLIETLPTPHVPAYSR